ncbi:hypothetical protein [Tenacibaculum geojense]|uniref:Lipoprotein n=1 Tax=Tenacibaculum geojense TaxID=915352 RepID=A0ABW3JSW9_9FLAO
MKKKINTKFVNMLLLASFFLLLTSCSEDEVSTNARVKLVVNTTSNTSGTQLRSSIQNQLNFSSGYITIREVVFDGENQSTNQSISRSHEQIASVNYQTGAISPELIVTVPGGLYSNVNLGIELQDDTSNPSVVIEGSYTNSNNEELPIRFEFNSGEVFEANAQTVMINNNADIVGKITFDAISWFSTVTAEQLDSAILTNGVIVISSTSNTEIFSIVADKLDVDTEAVFE